MTKKLTMLLPMAAALPLFFAGCDAADDTFVEDGAGKAPLSVRGYSKGESMEAFAKALSKAVYGSTEVRAFVKNKALEMIDNNHNVFYPKVKDADVDGRDFQSVLLSYAGESRAVVENVLDSVPLLNIHLPELAGNKVEGLDVSDSGLSVLLGNTLYLNGEAVDTLSPTEVPGFHVLVVCESSTFNVKAAATRSGETAVYEYVDDVFNPAVTPIAGTRAGESVEYETLAEKYTDRGYVSVGDLDPLLVQAYNNSGGNKRAVRNMLYYGLDNPNGSVESYRSDFSDCIYRIKISPSAFVDMEKVAVAKEGDDKELFHKSTESKPQRLTRDEVLRRLLTGQAFCLQFHVESEALGQNVPTEKIRIYALPDKIFNLKIKETRRHPTLFRHTKYTYEIEKNGIRSKWYYPLDFGHDTRLNRWNVGCDPIQKRIVMYIVNPDAGADREITESYTTTYLAGAELGFSLGLEKKDALVNAGINGKLSSSQTVTKQITTKYTVKEQDKELGSFTFNYFDDYPVEAVTQTGEVVLTRKGKGAIETSIVPVSNHYYLIGRYNK